MTKGIFWNGVRFLGAGLLIGTLCAAVLASIVSATVFAASTPRGFPGGGNPFPLYCVDLSGTWRADDGSTFVIQQQDCDWLEIGSVTIVPDNTERADPSGGTVRYRWNDLTSANELDTYRELKLQDRKVSELVTLEQVNANLLLQSDYITTTMHDGHQPPAQTYSQQVFRRVN